MFQVTGDWNRNIRLDKARSTSDPEICLGAREKGLRIGEKGGGGGEGCARTVPEKSYVDLTNYYV